MIVLLSDTHRQRKPDLTDHLRERIQEATAVCHAGDFTTTTVLDHFQDIAPQLYAVHGNADERAVIDQLPSERMIIESGVNIAMTHRKRGGETGLMMFGREQGADIVVSGHTHNPTILQTDGPLLVNPGSHADPRGNQPGYAEIKQGPEQMIATIYTPTGSKIQEVKVTE